MPGIFFLAPQPTFADPNEQIVQSAVTLTANGSAIVSGYGSPQVSLIVNITNAPTGISPTITFTMTEVDPIDQTTQIGGSVSTGPITGTLAGTFSVPVQGAGTFVVTWTLTGTTPSFSGVNVSVAALGNPQPEAAGTNRSTIVTPVSQVQTANYTNNSAPSLATLSNTVPSYSTLGGLWQFNSISGSETDYALFGYQVPTGSNLYLRSISIGAQIFGQSSSAQPTILQWAIGANATNPSLASGGPAFLPLGTMTAAQSSRIGDSFSSSPVNFRPDTPIVISTTKYLHIVLRIPMSNATPGQQIRGFCMIDGYFE
jgi:hypothetical protein